MSKSVIRAKILNNRKISDKDECLEANHIICENLLELLKVIESKKLKLALYYPMEFEPNILKLKIDCDLALPKIDEQEMKMVQYKAGDRIVESKFNGLYQPINKVEIKPSIVIVPGLAFSVGGYRLGYGFGYYDKYFNNQKHKMIKIGVCFHNNLFENLPKEEHDCQMQYLITDKISIKL